MNVLKIIEKYSSARYDIILVTSILSLISLYLRMGDLDYINRSLWAEDGNVFINQAVEFGYESIWIPYAGYLNLYPRIFTLIAGELPLELTPYVFFSAWLIAFSILVWILLDRAIVCGVGKWVTITIILLISLQPANGEIYFSITNVQWFMGAALIIYLLIPKNISTKTVKNNFFNYKEIPLIILMGLTGPFSILVLPGLAISFYVFKDFHLNKARYVTVFLCALIQLVVLVNSDRVNPGEIDQNIYHWLSALKIFVTFGGSGFTVIIFSLVYWVALVYAVINTFRMKYSDSYYNGIKTTIIITIAFITFSAGLYTMRASPEAIHPLLNGSRYYFIPYTLLFLSAVLISTEQIIVRVILICCLVVICAYTFNPIYRANIQYQAYVAFSKIKSDLIIPINPLWPTYPGWYIKPPASNSNFNNSDNRPVQSELLDLSQFELVSASAHLKDNTLIFESKNNDPQLSLPVMSICKASNYIGAEVALNRSQPGWAQLFWSKGNAFSEPMSIRRYFPDGDVTMYFAFDNIGENLKLRLDPLEAPGKVNIHYIKLYCLD